MLEDVPGPGKFSAADPSLLSRLGPVAQPHDERFQFAAGAVLGRIVPFERQIGC